jgi:inner membrane protein
VPFYEITRFVDPVTHALASYVLKRAAFPRVTRPVTLAILIAGTIADLDSFSSYFGPSAYLTFYRTYFHSLTAALLFSFLVTLPFLFLKPKSTELQIPGAKIFIAALAAALLHLLLDLCQSAGVELFWPFSTRRFALDWVAHIDLWILAILLAGILLPTLAGLVTEEIGARHKGPRGKLGAGLALAALFLYLVLRSVYHGNAIAALESRTYRGESSRRVAAFAESSSPFRWHGIVETDRALHDLEVPVGPGAEFDPLSAITTYKPEPSPALDAARDSDIARRFLQAARFPKASVEKTPDGYHVTLRDFPYIRDASAGPRVQALIDTNASGKILSEEIVWVPISREFWWK